MGLAALWLLEALTWFLQATLTAVHLVRSSFTALLNPRALLTALRLNHGTLVRGAPPRPARTVAFVLGPELVPGGPMLVDMVSWCAEASVQTVMFYHPTGVPAAVLADLQVALGSSATVQVGWGSPAKAATAAAGDDTGSVTAAPATTSGAATTEHLGRGAALARAAATDHASESMAVLLLSESDGYAPVIDAVRHAAAAGASADEAAGKEGGDVKARAAELFSSMAQLSGSGVLHAPDLILVCGRRFTLSGFPPFHTRVAEVYHLATSSGGVMHQRWLQAMARYQRTRQRFGQ